ncbi:hypothetical protein QUF61_15380 [Candidatus Venteria ishoeyi]|uniref:hypothetical protein n=1 Tax=Candidatus Venteria ishoeyi TaxID=1899563 RepID=UPI0025A4DF64|nr:hypothetical protein [Candidatus Venteria ishoeyi]MDM8547869.1 hypothetical protein [Candidatus Venteria ishoeyi]
MINFLQYQYTSIFRIISIGLLFIVLLSVSSPLIAEDDKKKIKLKECVELSKKERSGEVKITDVVNCFSDLDTNFDGGKEAIKGIRELENYYLELAYTVAKNKNISIRNRILKIKEYKTEKILHINLKGKASSELSSILSDLKKCRPPREYNRFCLKEKEKEKEKVDVICINALNDNKLKKALNCYRNLADNKLKKNGIERVENTYRQQIEHTIESGQLTNAEQSLVKLSEIHPRFFGLSTLRKKLVSHYLYKDELDHAERVIQMIDNSSIKLELKDTLSGIKNYKQQAQELLEIDSWTENKKNQVEYIQSELLKLSPNSLVVSKLQQRLQIEEQQRKYEENQNIKKLEQLALCKNKNSLKITIHCYQSFLQNNPDNDVAIRELSNIYQRELNIILTGKLTDNNKQQAQKYLNNWNVIAPYSSALQTVKTSFNKKIQETELTQRQAELMVGLDNCKALFRNNWLTSSPEGDSNTALFCYQNIKENYKNNTKAQKLANDGLFSIEQRYQEWADQALNKQQFNKISEYINKIIIVNPQSALLADIKDRVENKLVRTIQDKLTTKRLTEARNYLNRLERFNSQSRKLRGLKGQLLAAEKLQKDENNAIQSIRNALAKGEVSTARNKLARLKRDYPNSSQLLILNRDIERNTKERQLIKAVRNELHNGNIAGAENQLRRLERFNSQSADLFGLRSQLNIAKKNKIKQDFKNQELNIVNSINNALLNKNIYTAKNKLKELESNFPRSKSLRTLKSRLSNIEQRLQDEHNLEIEIAVAESIETALVQENIHKARQELRNLKQLNRKSRYINDLEYKLSAIEKELAIVNSAKNALRNNRTKEAKEYINRLKKYNTYSKYLNDLETKLSQLMESSPSQNIHREMAPSPW